MHIQNEIERKFLVKGLGWLKEVVKASQVITCYVASDDNAEFRITYRDSKWFACIKDKATLSRAEIDKELTEEEATSILQLIPHSTLTKVRYIVPYNDELFWEIDIFSGLNEGLIVAEIELPSVNYQLELPDWIGEEVTEEDRYYNSNLAKLPFTMWNKATMQVVHADRD